MVEPSFIHRKEEYLDRVSKGGTDVRLLARHKSMEVMKQKIASGASFYLDSAEDWQGFEFIYLLEGRMEYKNSDPPVELGSGDYISRVEVPEESWFETKTDVTVLYTSSQPAFFLLKREIEDYLRLAREIESTEHMDGHSKRLVRASHEVGKKLGLSSKRLGLLRYAAFFHDLGKARVPDPILEKEESLTEDEWEVMKRHTKWGREMLQGTEHLDKVGKIVAQSHEKVDGSGYPEGLERDEISLEARILAVVDAWDAMMSDRPYRDALTKKEAINELRENSGSQFDGDVVDVFLKVLEEKEVPYRETGDRETYKEESAQLRQREKLLNLSREVLSPESTELVLAKTLEAVIETTTFQRAVISVFDRPIDPENPEPARVKYYDYGGISEARAEKLEEDLTGTEVDLRKFDRKYRLGNSYYVPHDDRWDDYGGQSEVKSYLSEEETLDWHPDDSLYIPLYRDEGIIGQVSVDDPEDGLVPDPERLRPVESFASLASVGIEKTLKTEELQGQKHRLEELHAITEELRRQEGIADLCGPLADSVRELFGYDSGLLLVKEDGELVLKCSFPEKIAEKGSKVPLEGSIAGRTLEKGGPLNGSLENGDGFTLPAGSYESFLSLPLGDSGVLQLFSTRKAAFEEVDLTFLETFADRLREEVQRVRLEDELREKAVRDPLTGLYNRRYFNESVHREIERGKRYQHPVSLLMMDINDFKQVNDRYSHLTGDEVLKEIAELMDENIRSADLLVRYGGDEFLLLLPEGLKKSQEVAGRIKDLIDRWNQENDLISFPLGLSIGIEEWDPERNREVKDVLKAADEKMYAEKTDN